MPKFLGAIPQPGEVKLLARKLLTFLHYLAARFVTATILNCGHSEGRRYVCKNNARGAAMPHR